jgi:hypothetical protein
MRTKPFSKVEKEYIAWKLYSMHDPKAYRTHYPGLLSEIRKRFAWDEGYKLAAYVSWLRYVTP